MNNIQKRVKSVSRVISKKIFSNDKNEEMLSLKGFFDSRKNNISKSSWKRNIWYEKWITNWGGNKPK